MESHSHEPWLTDAEAEALHARALGLLQAGRNDDGAEILLALSLSRPTHGPFYRHLGLAWHRAEQFEKARMAYEAALDLDPSDHEAAALHAECGVQLLTPEAALMELWAVLQRPLTAASAPYVARVRQLHQHMSAVVLQRGLGQPPVVVEMHR